MVNLRPQHWIADADPTLTIADYVFMFFFEPSLEKWAVSDSSNWYRPYLAWFSVIVIVFLIQRWSDKREL